MPISGAELRAGVCDWVRRSTGLTNQAVVRANGNSTGPRAGEPYIIVELNQVRQISLQPTTIRRNGQFYKLHTWEMIAQIDAYRGEPFDLLTACLTGLSDAAIYDPAFLARGITVHNRGQVLLTPEVRDQTWDRHGQLRITLRCTPLDAVEIRKLNGVKITFRINSNLEISREIQAP